MASKYETSDSAVRPDVLKAKPGDVVCSSLALVWKGLRVSVKKNGKVLLNDISGKITSGFYAVMGPSGSGKTTMLNTLAYRLDGAVRATGDLRLNGRTYSQTELKMMAGYVMQDDLLVSTMSVQETLEFTAKLRLPPTTTSGQRSERIEAVMLAMGIQGCRDTVIGDALRKGVSGGERKRVCIAQELLTKPMLLFLDEPTSGLDSVTALSLCQKLRVLADEKICTVVSTIHQPQAKIFSLFTDLLLLKDGNIMYMGAAELAEEHFEKLGYPVELHENPADHIMDAMAIEAASEKLMKAYEAPDVNLEEGIQHTIVAVREGIPWLKQFSTCLGRVMLDQWRNRDMLYLNFLQSSIVAFFIGITFLHIGRTNASQVKRRNLIFLCILNQGVCGALLAINTFPPERALMLRERASGMYKASAYFVAKQFGDILSQIFIPWTFTCIVYFMIGLNSLSPSKFFIFGTFMMLSNIAAVSLALAISALSRTTDLAFTLLPFAFEVARNFGSFFLPPALIPKHYVWLDAMSYVKYAQTALTINEHWDLVYSDPPANGKGGPLTLGKQVLTTQGLWNAKDGFDLTISECAGYLVLYIFVARFIAYLGIRYIKW